MIAKKFLDKDGRLKISYFFDKDGNIKGGGNLTDLDAAIRTSLPHHVASYCFREDGDEGFLSEEMRLWFREQVSGAWTIWVVGQGSISPLFLFEREADALHFKMRWS